MYKRRDVGDAFYVARRIRNVFRRNKALSTGIMDNWAWLRRAGPTNCGCGTQIIGIPCLKCERVRLGRNYVVLYSWRGQGGKKVGMAVFGPRSNYKSETPKKEHLENRKIVLFVQGDNNLLSWRTKELTVGVLISELLFLNLCKMFSLKAHITKNCYKIIVPSNRGKCIVDVSKTLKFACEKS